MTIEVDITGISNKRGPGIFLKGLYDILPYNAGNCNFIASKEIYPIREKIKSDYYYFPFPQIDEIIYNKWQKIRKENKLILGPNFVPFSWENFPIENKWQERMFSEILKQIKGIAVHSERVRNHLINRTNTIKLIKKFRIIRPCTNIKPKNIKPFFKRKIDILFFEKYSDFNRSQQGTQMLNLLKNTSKTIEKMKYENYTKEEMEYLANNTKFIIYFSFFDTGAIGLKEIQNYGVYTFSHQRDLIIHNKTGLYVPELADEFDMSQAYQIIMENIKIVTNLNPDTQSIAKINQEINKCQNALNDLCESLF